MPSISPALTETEAADHNNVLSGIGVLEAHAAKLKLAVNAVSAGALGRPGLANGALGGEHLVHAFGGDLGARQHDRDHRQIMNAMTICMV